MKNLILLLSLLWGTQLLPAQQKLQRYEFAEFGISIPFFSEAVKTTENTGRRDARTRYHFESSEKSARIVGDMYLYSQWGCQPVDTFYNQMERYAAATTGNPRAFRPLTQKSHTHYLGWTFYDATLTVDNSRDNIVRKVQAFYNGGQTLIIDVTFINEDFSGIGKEIFDEPGYQSILRPLDLPELGLRLRIRGHVVSQYDAKEKKYYLGRCDRLGTLYPFVAVERAEGNPEMLMLGELAAQRSSLGFDNVKMENLPAEGKLSRFPGGIQKVVADEKGTVSGRAIFYFFSLNGKTYKVSLFVPYGPDDNRLFFKSDREINIETAKELDLRVTELLENLEVKN
ncbi:MAG: hypothetical protein R3C61_27260 [Bacteroidia bacterium]